MLVPLRSTLDLAPNDPAVCRLRDACLEPRRVGRDGLELVALALWTQIPARAPSRRRAIVAATRADLAGYGDPVGEWLVDLLDPRPAG